MPGVWVSVAIFSFVGCLEQEKEVFVEVYNALTIPQWSSVIKVPSQKGEAQGCTAVIEQLCLPAKSFP